MGRRPYMNLLTLGRSPYEPPEPNVEENVTRPSLVNADSYTQEYDTRGHPVNSSSKSLGKQLRKAKNDILSTMGIVVSGEDAAGSLREQQTAKLITDENDYGLAMTTIDQVVMFVCPWWVTSLAARIQTFGGYSRLSPVDITRWERSNMGIFGFYFAGMPAWIASFIISVLRNHFLGSAMGRIQQKVSLLFSSLRYKSVVQNAFGIVRFSARGALLLIAGQAYMFSLLQSLHILPSKAIPAASSFIPFAENSLIQSAHPPTEISLSSVAGYGFRLLTAPHVVIYLYVFLRPIIEGRMYRLLRRRLPKPDRPDKLSIRAAVDNDLIEWTVPTLGRRSEEEKVRSELDLVEEIIFELVLLKNWVKGLLKWKRTEELERNGRGSWTERYESVRNGLERPQDDSTFREANERFPVARVPSPQPAPVSAPAEQSNQLHSERAMPSDPANLSSDNQVILSDEEQRMTHSPLQLPEEYFRPMANTTSAVDSRTGALASNHQGHLRAAEDVYQPTSRSNTLFSRISSPESSPLTSPRVRASLVHQNSEIITMQLELLQSRRNANAPEQANTGDQNPNGQAPPSMSQPTEQDNHHGDDAVDREAAELLDALLSRQSGGEERHEVPSNHPPNVTTDRNVPATIDSDPAPRQAEELTRVATNGVADSVSHRPQDTRRDISQALDANTLRENQSDESARVLPIPTNAPRTFLTDRLFPYHRVTILSAHPVDSLASHLSTLITTVLFYPLESLYLRHLAFTFLTSRAVQSSAIPLGTAASTLDLQRYIRPRGAWFGGGGKGEIFSYVSKMILVTGIQAGISAGIWTLGTTVTVLLGRRKFGWGNL